MVKKILAMATEASFFQERYILGIYLSDLILKTRERLKNSALVLANHTQKLGNS